MRRPLFLLFALLMGAATASAQREVNLKTLLPELTDLRLLARRPSPPYTQAQASSYDRNSKEPGNEAWFANGDAGKFLREERKEGRIERVMADLRGPGMVNRIWSANPAGVVRFYFDGEAEPRFSWDFAQLLTGKIKPFVDPFAYASSRGCNLYFPIAYAKSLKITVDNSGNDGSRHLYYHIGYRTYPASTPVRSLTGQELQDENASIAGMVERLKVQPASERFAASRVQRQSFAPIASKQMLHVQGGSGAITYLSFRFKHKDPPPNLAELPWDHPLQLHSALRKVVLIADFDGERCIEAPISDFFASPAGISRFATLPMMVQDDGTMTCRFVMPFAKGVQLALHQTGGPQIELEFVVGIEPWNFGSDSYHFRAQWLSDSLSSRPMRDMEFLRATGEGVYVGTSLHIGNPTSAWWGEGDEKVFVDGEKFPSTFGTGTEDYFGYAWCDPSPFVRPYHSQPKCDGPGNRGHTVNVRWHISDPIPFKNELQFLIELWHWADVDVDYDRVAYWYAKPGSSGPAPITDLKSLLLTDYPRPQPVKGAIEGETARILSKTGGETEIQEFFELSDGKQLWWRDMKEGERLVLSIPVKEDGEYEVVGNFCMARDYGKHRLTLGGSSLGEIDFYSADLKWQIKSLGQVKLKAGHVELVVESAGHRAEAIPRNMFGLDYLLLKRIG